MEVIVDNTNRPKLTNVKLYKNPSNTYKDFMGIDCEGRISILLEDRDSDASKFVLASIHSLASTMVELRIHDKENAPIVAGPISIGTTDKKLYLECMVTEQTIFIDPSGAIISNDFYFMDGMVADAVVSFKLSNRPHDSKCDCQVTCQVDEITIK